MACASYSQNHICYSLQLLIYYRTQWSVYEKIVTSNQINSTIHHIKLVLDEKALLNPYIGHIAL